MKVHLPKGFANRFADSFGLESLVGVDVALLRMDDSFSLYGLLPLVELQSRLESGYAGVSLPKGDFDRAARSFWRSFSKERYIVSTIDDHCCFSVPLHTDYALVEERSKGSFYVFFERG